MGVLASAQLCRADAGLGEYPAIPFGTRFMVVKEPPPVSAFMPRAEPGTIFGPCEFISGSCWTYQHGLVKARTNIQPAGLSGDDLTWVKVHMSDWDTPDAPMQLPDVHLYDATTLAPVAALADAATRLTATCPHCICNRRKHKSPTPHNLVWGECFLATPPPPIVEGPLAEVRPEQEDDMFEFEPISEIVEEEPRASAVVASRSTKLLELPHACMALSDVAT